jgi:hypothetical protein
MTKKQINDGNRQYIIYQGQTPTGAWLKVVQNSLPNYERTKYFISSTFTSRRGTKKQTIIAKSDSVKKINEVLSSLMGRKVNLI